MKLLSLLPLILFSIASFSQVSVHTHVAQVSDASTVENRVVRFSGSVTRTETRGTTVVKVAQEGALNLRNDSGKTIIALVADFETYGADFKYSHDWFHKHHGLAPGETETIDVPTGVSVSYPIGQAPPPTPTSIKGYLRFVQFEDGSTWGKPEDVPLLFQQRAEIDTFLAHLVNVQQQQGDAAFIAELKARRPFGASGNMAASLEITPEQADAQTALSEVKARQKNAADRRATGKF